MELEFLQLKPMQSLKAPLVVSLQRTTCIYVGAASRLPLVSELIQDGIINAKQCPTAAQIADIGTEALPRVPFGPFINHLLGHKHDGK